MNNQIYLFHLSLLNLECPDFPNEAMKNIGKKTLKTLNDEQWF